MPQVKDGRRQYGSIFSNVITYLDLARTPAAVNAGATGSFTVSIPGAKLGDIVLHSSGNDLAGLMTQAYVSATNVVTVRTFNPTGSTVTPTASDWRFVVKRMSVD